VFSEPPGLERLLTPMVAESDAQVEAVLASQQNLAASIDRLVAGACTRARRSREWEHTLLSYAHGHALTRTTVHASVHACSHRRAG
jgi:hypothetical protein